MNSQRLLQHFDRIAEAPDAVARLRRLILDLAVRGKLVEQDPNDGPAGELLTSIEAEKAKQVKLGKIRRERPLPEVEPHEIPYRAPRRWEWVRLGSVTTMFQGFAFSSADFSPDPGAGLPLIKIRDIGSNKPEVFVRGQYDPAYIVHSGDLLLGLSGSIKCAIWEGPPALLNQRIARIAAISKGLHRRWLLFSVDANIEKWKSETSKFTVQNVKASQLYEAIIAIPPPAEQQRIVAKVDELMALSDRLEAAQNKREQRRDRLVAASLNRINQPAPSAEGEAATAFREHARFHLPRLTTRPEHIKSLRQSILNLAVRGKLVQQDPADEPASELLDRIQNQSSAKENRNLDGDLRRGHEVYVVYPIPPCWTWASIQELTRLGEKVTYGILKPVWVKSGIPTVRVTEMKTGQIDVATLPLCDPTRAAKFEKTKLAAGDLLISKDGTIGKTAFVPPALAGGNITQHVLRFPVTDLVDRHFIRLAIDAPFCQAWMVGETKGVALQGVNVGDFRCMPVPLPPLAEQHRIVAKVDELMAVCDQLETQLTTTQTDSRRLLEAVLHKALA